jgi:hypothetical protein
VKALRVLAFVALTTTSVVAGCAGATQGQPGRPNGTQLTQADLAAANTDNLYDAIAKLRPEWLSSRGPSSVTNSTPTSVDIYMNGTMLGKADYLRDMHLQDVTSVRYWDAGTASARFGMGHPRGVIEITRK